MKARTWATGLLAVGGLFLSAATLRAADTIKLGLPEVPQLLTHRLSQLLWRYGIDQCPGRGTPHDDPVLSQDMALNNPIASMLGHVELPIDSDSWVAGIVRVIAPQRGTRDV